MIFKTSGFYLFLRKGLLQMELPCPVAKSQNMHRKPLSSEVQQYFVWTLSGLSYQKWSEYFLKKMNFKLVCVCVYNTLSSYTVWSPPWFRSCLRCWWLPWLVGAFCTDLSCVPVLLFPGSGGIAHGHSFLSHFQFGIFAENFTYGCSFGNYNWSRTQQHVQYWEFLGFPMLTPVLWASPGFQFLLGAIQGTVFHL